jgi:hypothetical protein
LPLRDAGCVEAENRNGRIIPQAAKGKSSPDRLVLPAAIRMFACNSRR